MKTLYKLFLVSSVLAFAAGCEEQETIKFQFEEEAINFYMYNESLPETDYPGGLTNIYKPNTWYNRRKKTETMKVDFSVQTQGYTRDFDRKAVFKAAETTGWQAPLPITELTVPAGETVAEYYVIPINHVPFGRMTKWVIVFDYEKGDFAPGNIERQTRTITIDSRYTISSVNLKSGYWETRLQGNDTTPGFGTWSNIKTMFLIDNFGYLDFTSELYNLAKNDPAAFAEKVKAAADKLEEYKINSATDPAAYPPLLDDELNDGSWIKFNVK